jgi:hypothetical protein
MGLEWGLVPRLGTPHSIPPPYPVPFQNRIVECAHDGPISTEPPFLGSFSKHDDVYIYTQ